MSNEEIRWTRNNVDEHKNNNFIYINDLKFCDNCLVNASNNYREYAIARYTTKRKKKRSTILSTTAIKSCHRPYFSATRKLYSLLNLKIVSLFLILNNSNFLTCATSVVIDTIDFSKGGHYTHTWAVHIPNGDYSGKADQVAEDHGFVNLGKIFNDHYHFAHTKVQKRSLEASHHHQSKLVKDHRINWALQQKAKSRQKRDYEKRSSRMLSFRRTLVDEVNLIDPKWGSMWYLNRGGGLDMNVIPAWQQGVTGKGIVVTILDDGLEYDHPDIEHNYDPKASYDVNNNDSDPSPQYDMTDSNRHGTRCAGEVAATANNSFCAVGIAYGAKVGGVRMLDGDVTDAVEARSLSLFPQHIDIYSASWGPDDDGKTVDGPGDLATRAFIEGVTKGRDGKGSIFIWASGNGGRELDNCNCDGYTNSIWTLSISSATEDGNVPWYSEKCSSTLATTYSSGAQNEKQVVTTDLHHTCTVSHTGTSASAPLAAGIAALVLEANPNLTWRDLQHIVVRTAKPANLQDSTWSKNGVGRNVSHSFGYGLMDAAAMVKLAKKWKTVPEQQKCEIHAPHVDTKIPPKSYITLQLTVKHCVSVNFLEHVQAKITLTSQRRGDLQINLISPAGTKVTLLTHRIHDVSRSGFNQWPFMSVHTWGEAPHGNWQLEIYNDGRYMGHAMLREWSLILYGTTNAISSSDPISPRVSMTTPISNSSKQNVSISTTTPNFHQHYSAQYPRIPSSKQNKTPSYQQVSATYGVIYGINSKTKPKSQKTNKDKNKNQQPSKNYYRITSINKSSTTPRPKKTNSKKEKNGIKAPKQIKDNHRDSITTTSTPSSSSSTGNPHIRLFEKYEKIQQIFPEFQPYTPSSKQTQKFVATSSSRYKEDPKADFEILQIVNSGLDGNDNRKPSRENSSFKKQKNRGNSEMKIEDNNDNIKDNNLKEQLLNRNCSSTNKNTQITQWDMIFFGTETPGQPEDPVRISPFNVLSNNIDDTSSQWRDMQDIQQSEHNAIHNSAACQEFANQRCIGLCSLLFLLILTIFIR
ncbi:FURIN family protein [Megaselia abdita]